MSQFVLNFKSFGASALLIEWPNRIDETILEEIISLQSQIENDFGEYIIETVNAYNSLTLLFKPETISHFNLKEKVQHIYRSGVQKSKEKKKTWKIPVCYDKEFGIDLNEIATAKKCSIDEIIDMHTKPRYVVYFTGFLPGFLYLGGLPATVHIPRKSIPRLRIIKGAVAIGGQQTGIYPSDSPGGWNIVGNSPLEFFDPQQSPPCFAKSGDYLKFYSVDRPHYQKIKEKVGNGTYEIECVIQ